MRTPPTNWAEIMAQPHETETKLVVHDGNGGTTEYFGFDGTSGIYSCATHPMLFDKMSVGNCCSSQIDLTLVFPKNHVWGKYNIATTYLWDAFEKETAYYGTSSGVYYTPYSCSMAKHVQRIGNELHLYGDVVSFEHESLSDMADHINSLRSEGYLYYKTDNMGGAYQLLQNVAYDDVRDAILFPSYKSWVTFNPIPGLLTQAYVAGAETGEVLRSTNINAYPADGEHEDEYVIRSDETEQEKGQYIGDVIDADMDAYPLNGIAGGYWYVYDRDVPFSPSIPRMARMDVYTRLNGTGIVIGRVSPQFVCSGPTPSDIKTIQYSNSAVIVDGAVTLAPPISSVSVSYNTYTNANVLSGKYWSDGRYVYYAPSATASRHTIDVPIKIYNVTIQAAEVTIGIAETDWVQKGTYFIDTREWDAQHEFLTITGYDAMLKAEQYYYTPPVTITGWPKTDTVVVAEICQRIGVQLDSRTTLNKGYKVRMPSVSSDGKGSNTLREVLKWIGAAYGGNWCITDEGKLRLVPLVPTNTPIAIGTDAIDLNTSPQYDGIGTVHLIVGEDGEEYTAGSGGGDIDIDVRGMHFEDTEAVEEMADDVLAALQGYAYQPLTVTTAFEADPLWELGDKITVNGFTSQIAEMPTNFCVKYTVDVTAGGEDEIDHEYPFQSTEKQIERKIASSVASIKIDIDSIESRVETTEGAVSSLTLSVGDIEANVTDEQGNYTVLNLKSDGLHIGDASGTTTINGSSITAGSVISALVSADNITAGALDAGDISLTGAFLIKNNDVDVAVVGAAQGLDASGNTTYGAVLQSIDGTSYAIVTNAGVRLQSGGNRIVVTGSSVTCNGVPIGQAVFGA